MAGKSTPQAHARCWPRLTGTAARVYWAVLHIAGLVSLNGIHASQERVGVEHYRTARLEPESSARIAAAYGPQIEQGGADDTVPNEPQERIDPNAAAQIEAAHQRTVKEDV